ncbi:hypothetical protein PHLCEN_2v8143 [Hermanssonia centrifuga]|uniref:Uncharacterized protein n=1 Tax=Hermanssonia centrifuga TaxID=98765 RepID=A0A2R6NUI5_9APHY|nr:hypothetical protein PHLCEN_2v8143 [Hermanssonia centrifuga]
MRRCHEHTQALLDAFKLKTLWDDYGVVGDFLPFTADFPRADIHELLSPHLLHQVIKGTLKDHLVAWVEEYIMANHTGADVSAILADIDCRIAAVPLFPGLRRFKDGRGFKQWTGDDSKVLMKALGQMFLINQRLDKLAAAHVDFAARGMLNGPCVQLPNIVLEQLLQSAEATPLPSKDEDGNSDDGASDDEEGVAEGNTIDAEVVLAKCYDIQSGSLSLLLRLVFWHFHDSSVASSTTK